MSGATQAPFIAALVPPRPSAAAAPAPRPTSGKPASGVTVSPFPAVSQKQASQSDQFWIGEELVARGELTREQYTGARTSHAKSPGVSFIDTLLTLQLVSGTLIAELIANKHSLQVVDLQAEGIDPKTARELPAPRARSVLALPYKRDGDVVYLAIADPAAYPVPIARTDLKCSNVRFHVAPRRDILAMIEEAWRKETEAANASELLTHFAHLAIRERASDIHFEPRANGLEVRFRIDGELVHKAYLSADMRDKLLNAAMIAGRCDMHQRSKPQDGQAKLEIGGKLYTFRVATLPTVFGLRATLRVLDEDAHARSFKDQGLSTEGEQLLRPMLKQPNGVILVTGPTGSGKTTFLHCALGAIHAPSVNIITIEDPVEYTNPKYNQVPVNAEQGLSFATALRSVLRHDPDIILIGETRDKETAEIMVRSSLTGHLVFSTLHTNTAAGAVTRLLDMGVEPFLVATSLRAITAQRLVRRLCRCSVPHPHLSTLRKEYKMPEANFRAASPTGCPECGFRGFSRRVGIFEIFPIVFDHSIEIAALEAAQATELSELEKRRSAEIPGTAAYLAADEALSQARSRHAALITAEREKANEVVQLILNQRPESQIAEVYRRRGYPTLRDDGIAKAAAGITTLEEVFSEVL